MFPRAHQFLFVEGRYTGSTPAISCDGLVPGAALDLTHWQHNRTPQAFKADTSTEIALKFVASDASRKWSGSVVVNNHFDTDGVLSAWTLLDSDTATHCRNLLIAAAEAGDFDEWPGDSRGLWLDAAIRTLAHDARDDEHAYEIVLPRLADLIRHLDSRRNLWGAEWDALQLASQALEDGKLKAERIGAIGLMLHSPGQPAAPGPLLAREFLPGTNRYLLAFDQNDGTYEYRYERPRYAWADTVVRPHIPAPDAQAIAASLGPRWTSEGLSGMTAIVQTLEPVTDDPRTLLGRLREIDPV